MKRINLLIGFFVSTLLFIIAFWMFNDIEVDSLQYFEKILYYLILSSSLFIAYLIIILLMVDVIIEK